MSELSVNLNAATSTAGRAESSPMATDDGQLMVRLRQGDQAAMCELLNRHGEMLARLVGRLTAWHADREDILQEVLLSIWQKSGSYRGEGSLEGWIEGPRNEFQRGSSPEFVVQQNELTVPESSLSSLNPATDEKVWLEDARKKLQAIEDEVRALRRIRTQQDWMIAREVVSRTELDQTISMYEF